MKTKILCILITLLLIGCSDYTHKEDYGQGIINYLGQNGYTSRILESYDYIIFVSEIGCTGCDKSFSSVVSQKVSLQNALFIIMATGVIVDISAYKPAKNVIMYTYNKDKQKTNYKIEYYTPKVLFLLHGQLHETFELNARTLEDQLRYLNCRIK